MGRDVRIELLGPVRLSGPDGEIDLGGPRRATLLAVLAVRLGTAVSTRALYEELWGEQPPTTARGSLQSHVSRLRRILRDADGLAIHTQPDGYLLRAREGRIDASDVQPMLTLIRARAPHDPGAGLEQLDRLLGWWRGEPLTGVHRGPLLHAAAARLAELHAQAVELRMDLLLRLGRVEEALGELRTLVLDEPLRERLWAQLMLAQYQQGQHGDALATYERARQAFARHLGIEPGEQLRRLHADILARSPDLAVDSRERRRTARRSNLPATTTRFFGREDDLARLQDLTSERRLVTLLGPAGAGKTRLALEHADAVAPRFPDGTWLVDLLPLRDAAVIGSVLARTIGADIPTGADVDAMDAVTTHLRDHRALLVLDNCEHLLEPVGRVVWQVLTACPDVTVLATSRERLRVDGEAVHTVHPLPSPSIDWQGHPTLDSPALALLVDRARAVRPDLDAHGQVVIDLARVCRRLDGLPLALELAAPWLRSMSAAELADRLDDRLDLLNSDRVGPAVGRARTLRAALQWSHDLLDPTEQRVLRRLAVFAGPFDLQAAEHITGDDTIGPDGILDALAGLVDKSLVQTRTDEDGGIRHVLLETVRTIAAERLEAAGEADAIARRHGQHYLHLAETLAPSLQHEDQHAAVARLHLEADNLRAAMEGALDRGEVELAVRLLSSLWAFWFRFGYTDEGHRLVNRVGEAAAGLADAARGEFLAMAGNLAWFNGDIFRARSMSAEALAIARRTDDASTAAGAATILAMCEFTVDLDRALSGMQQAHAIAVAGGDAWHAATTRCLVGFIHRDAGRLADARVALEDALDRYAELGEQWGISLCNFGIGTLLRLAGDLQGAGRHLARAIRPAFELGEAHGIASNLAAIGGLLVDRGDHERGAVLLAAAEHRYELLGARTVLVVRQLPKDLAAVKARLGTEGFRRAWDEGRRLRVEQAVQLAEDEAGRPAVR